MTAELTAPRPGDVPGPDGGPDRSSRIGRGLVWSLVSNVGLRLGNLAVGIAVARLVAPEQYGVYAVALTVWMILSTLAEFGLGSDLIRADDLERRVPTVATLSLLVSVGLAAGMALAAGPLAAAFGSAASAGVIRLMALSVAVFGLSVVPSARLAREFAQRTLTVVNGAALVVSAALTVTLALGGAGAWSLAWGQLAGQVVTVAGLHLATRTRPHLGFDRAIAAESLRFSGPLAVANLASWVLISIDNLVVSRTLGTAELAFYVIAFNISSWPMTAIAQSVRVVALPGFAQVEDAARRNRALVLAVACAAGVAVLAAVLLSTLAAPVVAVLYGAQWAGAVPALAGLAVFGGLRVVLDLLATFLVSVGATVEVLVVQAVWLVVMVPAMVVGVRTWGLAGAGWTHVVVALAVAVPLYLVVLRRVGVHAGALVAAAARPALVAVPAAVLCWWIAGRDTSAPLMLGAGTVAALLVYGLPVGRWWLGRIDLLRRPAAPAPDVLPPHQEKTP